MLVMTREFTPALGHAALTPLYDAAIALLTREGRWRGALLEQVAPINGERILDVGCGTGSFALMLKRTAPSAAILGIDPDPAVLSRAAAKARSAQLDIDYMQGFARDAARAGGRFDKVVSSLVFHQVPMREKRAGLEAIAAALKPNGELHIADYGLQRTPLMRALFKQIQRLDGFENTTPNAEGVLPDLMREAGLAAVEERAVLPTPTGSISLYYARAGAK